jgi:tRNA pseudouridine38-40 synthase
VRLLIEYDGADFSGWQRQPHRPSIQAAIEDILGTVIGRKTPVYGASRTDSGVHARGQVANFYTDKDLAAEKWAHVLNYSLPSSVRILESRAVPAAFHAQKAAIGKMYDYRILNRAVNSGLDRRVFFLPSPLRWTNIQKALPYFVGEHDFRAFQAAKADVVTTVRRIDEFRLIEEGAGFYTLRICGNGFLKQMVRAIVGTLVEVGLGKRDPGSLPHVIASRDRRLAGRTAPASGLTLVKVFYPES